MSIPNDLISFVRTLNDSGTPVSISKLPSTKFLYTLVLPAGRTKVYKNLVDGNFEMETGVPESFNVLTKEIRSLGIDIDLEQID